MRKHLEVAEVQHHACGVLRNMSVLSDIKMEIMAAGGVVAILAAMKEHLEDSSVQQRAYGALGNLLPLKNDV